MKEKREQKKNSKGITLIALVITVIVLLILAGIAIRVGLNEGNLFEKANEAKSSWNEKVDIEEESVKNALNYIAVKIPEELEIGDTVNWTPSGHYTWDPIYYADNVNLSYLVTDSLYSGDEVPEGALSEWSSSITSPSNFNMTISEWKVLKIDRESGSLVLVPSAPTTVSLPLCGAQGYNNASKLLNDVCSSLYGSDIGVYARCITMDDLESLMTSETAQNMIATAKDKGEIKTGQKYQTPYSEGETQLRGDDGAFIVYKSYPALYEEEKDSDIDPTPEFNGRKLGISDARDTFITRENSIKTATNSIHPVKDGYALLYDEMETALGEYADLFLFGSGDDWTYWLNTRRIFPQKDSAAFLLRTISNLGNTNALTAYTSKGARSSVACHLFPYVELTSGTITTPVDHVCTFEAHK